MPHFEYVGDIAIEGAYSPIGLATDGATGWTMNGVGTSLLAFDLTTGSLISEAPLPRRDAQDLAYWNGGVAISFRDALYHANADGFVELQAGLEGVLGVANDRAELVTAEYVDSVISVDSAFVRRRGPELTEIERQPSSSIAARFGIWRGLYLLISPVIPPGVSPNTRENYIQVHNGATPTAEVLTWLETGVLSISGIAVHGNNLYLVTLPGRLSKMRIVEP